MVQPAATTTVPTASPATCVPRHRGATRRDPHIARCEHDAGRYLHGSHAANHDLCCTRAKHDLSRMYTYRAGRAGTVYQMTTPAYSNAAMPVTTTYGTPVQGYTTMPAQTTYAPVRRRFPFGLFQRWRQQAMPTYTTMPGYTSPSVHIPGLYNDAHVYHRSFHDSRRSLGQLRDGRLHDTCLFCDDLHFAGRDNAGRHGHKHSRAASYDGAADDPCLHADHAHRPEQPRECRHARHGHGPGEHSRRRRAAGPECPEPAGRDSGCWSNPGEVHSAAATDPVLCRHGNQPQV